MNTSATPSSISLMYIVPRTSTSGPQTGINLWTNPCLWCVRMYGCGAFTYMWYMLVVYVHLCLLCCACMFTCVCVCASMVVVYAHISSLCEFMYDCGVCACMLVVYLCLWCVYICGVC